MKAGDRTFYDGYWKDQLALACDEKCRLRFILSEVDTVVRRETRAAVDLGTRLGTAGPRPRLRIADVGCGRGWLTEALSHFGEAVGFDQSTVEAARRYPHLRFVECDVLELERAMVPEDSEVRPGPNAQGRSVAAGFDVAVCSEVIEHVRPEDQPRLVESISKILRQDGILILTTPNRPVVADLVRKLSLQPELQPVEEWLDAGALSRLLRPQFEVMELTTVMFFPAWVRTLGPLSRAYRILYETWGAHRVVDQILGPTLRGLYLAIVARKRGSSPQTATGAAVGAAATKGAR